MDQQEFELQDRASVAGIPEQEIQRQVVAEFSLPPADGGKDAWLLLSGAFVVEGLTWGYAFSYGIFQEFYSDVEQFQNQKNYIPIIGTTSTGIMYLCSPVALPLLRRYPHRRRQGMVAGLVILCTAYMAASFAKNVRDLIITQGVLAGIGLSMVYYPVFMFIDEWFIRRKGLAYGVAWAASGLSGLILPFIFSWSLEKYSFRTTLRMWALVNLVLIVPALLVLKPRTPYSASVRINRPRFTFAKNPSFIIFCTGNMIVGLGYFLPTIYLPSYARSLGFSNAIATSSVSVLNIGTFLGFVCGGILNDHWTSSAIVSYSTIGTTLTVLLIWGFSYSPAVLIVFAFFYSFFGACFVTTWSGLTRDFVRKDISRTAEPGIVYAFFIAGRGIGNVLSGPLSQALLHTSRLTKTFSFGYGSDYGALIVFVAFAAMLGGLGPFCEVAGTI